MTTTKAALFCVLVFFVIPHSAYSLMIGLYKSPWLLTQPCLGKRCA